MKLGSIQQSTEDVFDLLAHDARTVVDHGHAIARTLRRREPPSVEVFDDDGDFGKDAAFLARIQRVVDRFLHRGEQGSARVVKAKKVAVLDKELADRDFLLPC